MNETWVPESIPLDKPNVSRMVDYWLGGYHNFEADRAIVEQINSIYPDAEPTARLARACLRRIVTFLVSQGIDQFLDLGSGIPTIGNVHQVAQEINPTARVVYVDIDPVAVAHGKAILANNPNATSIQGDVHQIRQVLDHAEVKELLDFGRPMAVLYLSILHFIVDDKDARDNVRIARDAMVPGSYIAIAHATFENSPGEVTIQVQKLYANSSIPSKVRNHDELLPFFEGTELVEPGLVYAPAWRPEGPDDTFLYQPERSCTYVGVGRKL